MRTITGTAKYKDGTPAIGVNVSLALYNREQLGIKYIAQTDIDGKWTMSFDSELGKGLTKGLWIQATSNLSGAFWSQRLLDNLNVYNIDFKNARGVTVPIAEVVTYKDKPAPKSAPKPAPQPSWWSKNKLWVYVGGGVLLWGAIVTIVVVRKRRSKSKN
tara:strand:- start:2341 stop:2817 length:477 start_codon:yes stop_codon:yes gene_type:complete